MTFSPPPPLPNVKKEIKIKWFSGNVIVMSHFVGLETFLPGWQRNVFPVCSTILCYYMIRIVCCILGDHF